MFIEFWWGRISFWCIIKGVRGMLPREKLYVKNAALFCILAVCIITGAVTAKLEGVFLVTPSLQPIFFNRPP